MTTTLSQSESSNPLETIYRNSAELVQCAISPHYFLSQYAWIINKNTAKVVKWQPWQYQLDLLGIFQEYHEIVIAKARQLGITWLVTGFGLWNLLFKESAKVLYMSEREEGAWELVEKSRFIWSKLPDWMKLNFQNEGRSWLKLMEKNGEIKALPSTDKAGRGTDATLVVRDELRDHPYGAANYVSISPAIDGGGQLIDLSTYNKYDLENHFSQRVADAMEDAERVEMPSGIILYKKEKVVGERISKTCLIFMGWDLRPVRQEGMTIDEWFNLKIIPKYSVTDREQEYPRTIEEMLRQPQTRSFFDIEAINQMEAHIEEPVKSVPEFDTFNGVVKVYKKPMIGRRYVIFTDPSNGIEDPFCTVVMDWQTWEIVASAHGRMSSKEVGKIHDILVRAYNNAYNTGEVNTQAGGTFWDTLKELSTPNLAPRRDVQGKVILGKEGWYTNEPLRDRMLHDYKEAVRKLQVVIHDKEALMEHRQFVQPEGETKPRAIGGAHDDWIIACAGAWYLRKFFTPPDSYGIKSEKYHN